MTDPTRALQEAQRLVARQARAHQMRTRQEDLQRLTEEIARKAAEFGEKSKEMARKAAEFGGRSAVRGMAPDNPISREQYQKGRRLMDTMLPPGQYHWCDRCKYIIYNGVVAFVNGPRASMKVRCTEPCEQNERFRLDFTRGPANADEAAINEVLFRIPWGTALIHCGVHGWLDSEAHRDQLRWDGSRGSQHALLTHLHE